MKTLSTKNLLAKAPFTKDLFTKEKLTGWLPGITPTRTRVAALTAMGLAVTGSALAGAALGSGSGTHPASAAARPAVTSNYTGGQQVATTAATAAAAAADKAAQVASQPRDKEVNVDYQPQSTFYYCGPAATRIAATAQGQDVSQDDLATKLGTTVNGTNSAEDTTRVLNKLVGSDKYHTTSVPGTPDHARADQVQADVMRSLNDGRAVVANIAGATTDVTGATHEFPGGHYLTVVGYHDNGGTVRISDPADVNGASDYWISTSNLTHWMATRGYSH